MNIKIKYIYIIFLLLPVVASGQKGIDTSSVNIRSFDDQALDAYRQNAIYNYKKDPKIKENFLERLWNSFIYWLHNSLGERNTNRLMMWLLLLLTAVGVFFFIRFAQKGRWQTPVEHIDELTTQWNEVDEHTTEEQLESMLQQAKAHAAYRTAVRLYFLILLKRMDATGEIAIQEHKTNHDYLLEISDAENKETFSWAVNVFEYVWYGEFHLEPSEYARIFQTFDHTLQSINPAYV